jgi:hypothetical protein
LLFLDRLDVGVLIRDLRVERVLPSSSSASNSGLKVNGVRCSAPTFSMKILDCPARADRSSPPTCGRRRVSGAGAEELRQNCCSGGREQLMTRRVDGTSKRAAAAFLIIQCLL